MPLQVDGGSLDQRDGVIRQRMRRELRRQPRWLFWVMPVPIGLTFAAMLTRTPDQGFGGPVWYFVVLGGSAALLALWVLLLLLRGTR